MTHGELLLLTEAASAGWHGAKAREAMLTTSYTSYDSATDWEPEERAVYHARLAARAALRAIDAVEEVVHG